jgi:hypothetical protein
MKQEKEYQNPLSKSDEVDFIGIDKKSGQAEISVVCKHAPVGEGLEYFKSTREKLKRVAVTEYPTENGPADYALFVDGQFPGIIEAKKVSVDPQNVLEQAIIRN